MEEVVEAVFFVLVDHGACLRFDRDAALALDIELVQDLLVSIAGHDRARVLQQPVGERALAVVDVGDDTEVSVTLERDGGNSFLDLDRSPFDGHLGGSCCAVVSPPRGDGGDGHQYSGVGRREEEGAAERPQSWRGGSGSVILSGFEASQRGEASSTWQCPLT
ncbi:hypothetical protein QBC45DRAFT_425873 [Copromyces sp. CBS 386.78]|nr:hypothetical protein QBC45DRAFT_425873 [Copromyces sp. CBS 386.78]